MDDNQSKKYYGAIKSVDPSLSKGMEGDLRNIQARLDALPEQTKKELLDLLFEHTENIVNSVHERLEYP